MDERLQQFETKMEKTCEYLEADFMTIRAGRANPQKRRSFRQQWHCAVMQSWMQTVA